MQFCKIIASKSRVGERKKASLWGEGWGVALYPTSHLFMSRVVIGMQFCKIIASKGRGEREKKRFFEYRM